MADKVYGEIYETRDYSKFKEIKGNRTADHSDSVLKSIDKVGYILSPILVNEKFEIADGNNRFKASKELGLPIRYMIQSGIGLAECISLNIGQKNWTLKDFVLSYAEQGNENYVKLAGLMKRHPTLTVSDLGVISTSSFGHAVSAIIESGNFKFKPDNLIDEDEVATWVEHIRPYIKVSPFPSRVIQNLIGMAQNGFIDLNIMEEQIKKYSSDFKECNNKYLIESIERLYNFNKKNKVYFATEVRKMMSGRQQARASEANSRKVLMLDKDGTVLNEFKSITEASNFLGVNFSSISHCLTGRAKTCRGYVWKYA